MQLHVYTGIWKYYSCCAAPCEVLFLQLVSRCASILCLASKWTTTFYLVSIMLVDIKGMWKITDQKNDTLFLLLLCWLSAVFSLWYEDKSVIYAGQHAEHCYPIKGWNGICWQDQYQLCISSCHYHSFWSDKFLLTKKYGSSFFHFWRLFSTWSLGEIDMRIENNKQWLTKKSNPIPFILGAKAFICPGWNLIFWRDWYRLFIGRVTFQRQHQCFYLKV